MNRVIAFSLLCFFQTGLYAQDIPDVKLTTLDGNSFHSSQFNQVNDVPIVLSFWATWCIPCLNELTAVSENMDPWKAELKFDFYAISEDDSRTAKKVQPLTKGKGWNFNILLDKNQDLKRGLNMPNVPYTIVVKNGKIIYRHSGYVEGDENELYRVIKENQ